MDYQNKSNEELINELNKLHFEMNKLKSDYKRDLSYQKQIEFKLRERKKELDCHNKITEILIRTDINEDEVVNQLLEIISKSWQFPEIAEVCICLFNKTYQTSNYKKSKNSIYQDIKINQNLYGEIIICYPDENIPDCDELFLEDEYTLMVSIAMRIAKFAERLGKTKQLKETEDKFRKLIENINDVIYEIDDKGIIKYISPSVEKLLGFKQHEIIGKSYSSFVGGNAEYLASRLNELKETNLLEKDYEVSTKTGQIKWIRFSTKAAFEGDVFIGGTGTLIDITENKQIQIQLQKSEALYRSIINTSPDNISICDLDGKITFVSPIALKMFGYDDFTQILNRKLTDFIADEDHEKAQNEVLKMFEGITGKPEEYLAKRANGDIFYIEVSGEIIIDENGNPYKLLFIIRDITERKKFEELFIKSEAKFRNLVENTNDVIYEISADATINYVSPAIERILGYKPEELLGKNFFDYMFEEDKPRLISAFSNLDKTNSPYIEYRYYDKDGEIRWVRSSSIPIIEHGKMIGANGVLIDIHERKLLELSLLKSNRLKSVISNINHAIVVEKDAISLFKKVCEITVGFGKFQMAWIGLTDGKTQFVKPIAVAGFENNYLSVIKQIDVTDTLEGKGPTGTAIRQGIYHVCNDIENDPNMLPWKEEALKRDYKSSIALPIKQLEKVIGAFTIYSSVPHFFNQEEIELLNEVVNNICFALDAIENEKQRQETLIALKESEYNLTRAQEIAKIGSWGDDLNGKRFWSDQMYKIHHVSPEEFKPSLDAYIKMVHPDDAEKVEKWTAEIINNKIKSGIEFRILTKENTTHYIYSLCEPITDKNGNFLYLTGISQDITEQKLAEDLLRKSEADFRTLIETAPVGMAVFDNNQNIVLSNNKFKEITGYSGDIKTVNDWWPIAYPDEKYRNEIMELWNAEVNRHFRENDIFKPIEAKVRCKNGDFKNIEIGFVSTEKQSIVSFVDVTERRKAENTLRESENFLKNLVNSQTNYVLRTNIEGKHIYWNNKFEEEFGWIYEREGIENGDSLRSICDYHHQRTKETVEKCIRNVGEIFKIELDKPAKDGSIRTTLWEFVCLTDTNNNPYEIQCMGIDITDRKIAENSLLESEHKYKALFYESPYAYLIVIDGVFVECNRASEMLIGGSRSDIIGKTPPQISPDFQPNGKHSEEYVLEVIKEAFDNGTHQFEWFHQRVDGSIFLAQINLAAIEYEGKEALLVMWKDITLQKENEKEIAKLSSAVMQSPVSIVITNLDGNIEYANPKACETTGYSLEELKGKNPRVLKSGETKEKEYEKLWKDISNGKEWKGIFHNKKKNGEFYWESSTITPITDSQGKITNYLAVKEDITERIKIQLSLQKSEERFRQIAEQSQTVIWEIDADGLYTYVSEISESVWGYKPEELINKMYFYDLHPKEGRKQFKNNALDYFTKKIDFKDFENSILTKDGDLKWVLTNAAPILDENNNLIGYRGADNDITQRKLAEDELLKFKTISDQANYGNALSDLKGFLIYSNEEFARMHGYKAEEILGKHLSMLHTEEQMIRVMETIEMLQTKGEFSAEEVWRKRKDGSFFPSLMNGKMIFDNNNQPLFLSATAIDISEIKQKENELIKSEEALNLAQQIANMGSWILNFKTNEYKWSKNNYKLAKLDINTPVTSEIFFGLLHPDDINTVISKLATLQTDKKPDQFEFRISINNGLEYRLFENYIVPIIEDNEVIGVNGVNIDITEKKIAEKALLESEASLNNAQQIANMGNWEHDFSTNKLIGSKNYYALLGLSPDDKDIDIYAYFEKIIHPDDIKVIEYLQQSSYGENEIKTVNFRLIMPDGKIKWLQNNVVAVYDNNNKISGLKGVNIDITEKINTDIKIKEQNDKLNAIISAIPDIIFVIDHEGFFKEFYCSNPEVLIIPPEKIIGKHIVGVFGETDSEKHIQFLKKCKEDNRLTTYEYDITNLKNETEYYEARLIPISDNQVLYFIRNITEKVNREAYIKRLSLAVEQSPVMVVITDLNSKIEYVNPAFVEITGYTKEETIGKSPKILKSGKTERSVYNDLWENLRKGKSWSGEWINKKKNGEFFWETVSITPIMNEAGKIANYLAIKQDITQRKKSEQEIRELNTNLEIKIEERTAQLSTINSDLQKEIEVRKKIEQEITKARQEAEQANLAKSEFLSRMSHELRTPMNSILGFAQLLQMGELNPAQTKGVNHIMHSGKHLLDLINEVLDISRIEAGRLSLSMEPVKLNMIIHEIMDIMLPNASQKNISLKIIENTTNQIYIKSDRQRLKQVLINLISNAVKYNMECGTVIIKTELMPEKIKGFLPVRISVTDTGFGINEEDLPKIFIPFERIGAEKTATEGTGLGLAVVKKLMNAMGGNIGVESVKGEGSTFWIELPQCESQLSNAEKSGILEGIESQLDEKKGKILYIEDNVSNIELVEQILSSQRTSIELITNMYGGNTLKLAKEHKPNLILLDLNLPDMHGAEVMKMLQQEEQTKNIPVIVISADAMPQQLKKLLNSGARDYLTKPLDVMSFLKVIDIYFK